MHRLRQHELVRLLRRYGVGGHMLDVGCGAGLMLRHLPPGSVGPDINPRNLVRAARYAPRASVVQGDAEALPFSDSEFTTVISTEVLEHVVYPDRMVAEIYRVLAPGGVFIGSVPRDTWLWALRALSSTCPGEPFHNEMRRPDIERLLQPFRQRQVRLAFWLMHYFFIARKPR